MSERLFALQDFNFVATDRLDVVQDTFNRLFQTRRISQLNLEQSPDINISLARLPYSNLFVGSFGCNINAELDEELEDYHLFVPLRGEILYRGANSYRVTPGQGLMVSPGSQLNISWKHDCYGINLVTAKEQMQRVAKEQVGVDEVPPLPLLIDLTSGVGLSLANILQTLLTELEDEQSLLSRGITTRAHNELLLSALLQTADRSQEIPAGLPAPVDLALNYIEQHLQEPITLKQLATASHTSCRNLQLLFRKYLQQSPMAVIKREKLNHIRRQLLQADAETTSVADLAASHGFYHASNFTRLYRQAFGETPTETLKSKKE